MTTGGPCAEASFVAVNAADIRTATTAILLRITRGLGFVESLARETSPADLRAADWGDGALITESV
jgi:hypothetical protein